jgi:hypothetical protein
MGLATLAGAEPFVTDAMKNGSGISSWAEWNPARFSRQDCPGVRSVPIILRWDDLQPSSGTYRFDQRLGSRLQEACDQGLYVSLMVWAVPFTPAWVYEKGVPAVRTDRKVDPLGRSVDLVYPYYFSEEYQTFFFGMLEALGAYLDSLPAKLRRRIIFFQSAEGSTGDGQPYKGRPLDSRYEISSSDWNVYRRKVWIYLQEHLPNIPILVNLDANTEEENDWLLDHMDVVALKQGMFSHGYHVSDNQTRLAVFRALEKAARERGKVVYSRGEMDGELFVMGWAKQNIPRTLYWSALFATHCGLDVWNVPEKALKDRSNDPAVAFFNKYAFQKDPSAAPAAFCALRDGLDASDYDRFPISIFGGSPGQRKEIARYQAIADAYSSYGARLDDPGKVFQHGMINRKRSGPNDVGWKILPGNYCRFLEQVDPGKGDVGLWNVDDSIYGRFARSFEHKTGKECLRFKLNEYFFGGRKGNQLVTVTITYLDRGDGEWTLNYMGKRGKACAVQVKNRNSREWKTVSAELTDLQVGEVGATDFELQYKSGDDTVFHMIEVEREKGL